MWKHTTENWTAALFDQYLLTTYAIQYLNAKENMSTFFINFSSLLICIPLPTPSPLRYISLSYQIPIPPFLHLLYFK